MIQIYFLLVVSNILSGLTLAAPYFLERSTSPIFQALNHRSWRRALGLVAVVVGVFGVLSVLPGDIPLIGNLIPGASAILVGLALFVGQETRLDDLPPWASSLVNFIHANAPVMGIAAVLFGLIHFFFPQVVFV